MEEFIMKNEVVQNLNQYLADIGVSYIKMHNLHWNVVGPQFKAVHEYLESIYDSYADVLDDVAEILKMNGEYPAASMKDYLAVSKIAELESRDYPCAEAIRILHDDMVYLRGVAADVRAAADEAGEFNVVAKMEDDIANYNKQIWFVEAMMK